MHAFHLISEASFYSSLNVQNNSNIGCMVIYLMNLFLILFCVIEKTFSHCVQQSYAHKTFINYIFHNGICLIVSISDEIFE